MTLKKQRGKKSQEVATPVSLKVLVVFTAPGGILA